MTEHISALQGLIGNLVTNAQDIIPKLGGAKIINAKCNIVDVEGTNGASKRCYLQIQTVQDAPQNTSSASIVEITEEEYVETSKPNNATNKRKKVTIVDEALYRRSDRLAKIHMGFKDKSSTNAAQKNLQSDKVKTGETASTSQQKKASVAINLGPKFDSIVIDKQAPHHLSYQ